MLLEFEPLPVDKDKVLVALSSWHEFNNKLLSLNASELEVAFKMECLQTRRTAFLSRLIQRLRVVAADEMERLLLEQQKLMYGEVNE